MSFNSIQKATKEQLKQIIFQEDCEYFYKFAAATELNRRFLKYGLTAEPPKQRLAL